MCVRGVPVSVRGAARELPPARTQGETTLLKLMRRHVPLKIRPNVGSSTSHMEHGGARAVWQQRSRGGRVVATAVAVTLLARLKRFIGTRIVADYDASPSAAYCPVRKAR